MSRFVSLGAFAVNADKVRRFWRVSDYEHILKLELDDGRILDVTDGYFAYENALEGREHIIQVFPVAYPLYATYKGDERSDIERPIRYMGLCANGEVRPLELCSDGLCFADDTDDFIELHEEEGCKMTKRQVNALEGINDKLGSISGSLSDTSMTMASIDNNLDNCVAYTGRASDCVFRIAGDVFTN